jgi:hypothetical protein
MTWLPVHRFVHLPGGLRLVNRIGPLVEFDAGDGKGARQVLELQHYEMLYIEAARLGLLPLGVEVVGSRDEQQGFSPSSFRSLDLRGPIPWPCGQQADNWQCLAHAATLVADPLIEDIASRISHELRNCDELIFNLSKTYEAQRTSALRAGKSSGERFIDGFTSAIYQALEAFLVRACVLRDGLAEFYAWTWRAQIEALRLTTLGALLKALKKSPQTDAFASALSSAASIGGWLHTLGAYRDLIVHVAPVSHADGHRVVIAYEAKMANGLRPIAIKMPMPLNPTGLSKERASGRFYSAEAREQLDLDSAVDDVGSSTDVLEYAAMALQKLTTLAATALALSPIAPVMPELGPADILDLTVEDVIPPI